MARDKKVAAVVGSGPNGLAAAIALAQSGLDVTVYEKHKVIGGGCRSLELIKEGYIHDICSTVHLQVKLSPFFQKLNLEEFGLRWITPPFALANPFDDGTAVVVSQSMPETVASLDSIDEKTYARLMSPLVEQSQELMDEIIRFPSIPFRHPFVMLKFGRRALAWARLRRARRRRSGRTSSRARRNGDSPIWRSPSRQRMRCSSSNTP